MNKDEKAKSMKRFGLGCFGSCLAVLGFPILLFGIWYLAAGYCIDGPCTDRVQVGPVTILIGALISWAAVATLRAMKKYPKKWPDSD